MKDIKDYLEQTNTVLLTKDAFELLKERASVLDKIKAEIDQLPSYVAKFAGGSFAIHIDKEKVLQIIDKRLSESEEESAREWCKQNGYVMMSEAVYEQDITKAYFEGQNAEPCDDCISRKSVIDVLIRNRVHFCDMVRITSELKELPSVTPKQKMGHWILTDDDFVYCSECEDSYYPRPIDASWYYCPHCGAKMESEDTE